MIGTADPSVSYTEENVDKAPPLIEGLSSSMILNPRALFDMFQYISKTLTGGGVSYKRAWFFWLEAQSSIVIEPGTYLWLEKIHVSADHPSYTSHFHPRSNWSHPHGYEDFTVCSWRKNSCIQNLPHQIQIQPRYQWLAVIVSMLQGTTQHQSIALSSDTLVALSWSPLLPMKGTTASLDVSHLLQIGKT